LAEVRFGSIADCQARCDRTLLFMWWRAVVVCSVTVALALLKSAGQDGPLLYPGPCAAVRRGRQAAQRASTRMSMPFRTGRRPVRKARPRLTDLPARDGRQAL